MKSTAWLIPFLLLICNGGCSPPAERESLPAPKAATRPVKGHQSKEEPGNRELPLRAVSLRVLQERLAACRPRGNCPEDVVYFGRLTRILGFSLDKENNDVLVYGLASPELPRIHIDDFVVALRNSWLKYAPLKGNTYQYTSPGCDIRPQPAHVLQLQRLERQLLGNASPEQTETLIRSWVQTCELPQTVSVLGLPFDTHFGQVMVRADYDMKRLADGSDHLALPGFASMMDRELADAKAAILQHRPIAIKASDRFWLTAGDQAYEEATGITWIRACPVRIRTRPTGADRNGVLGDVSGTDAAAEDFARRFSALYDKVAEQRPQYRELWSLFQIFALTQGLHFRNAPANAGLDLGYLLNSYHVSQVPLKHAVPGRHVVKRLRHEESTPDGTEIVQMWIPSCGGVDMGIEPTADQFHTDQSHDLPYLEGRMADARPIYAPPAWNVSLDEENEETLRKKLLLQQLNQPGSPLVVTVVDHGTGYHVVGTDFEYQGLRSDELIHELQEYAKKQGTQTIHLDLQGFSEQKAANFTTDCKLQLQKLQSEADLRSFMDIDETTLKILFTPGIEIVESSTKKAEHVEDGAHKGLFQGFISFLVRVGDKLYTFTLTIVGSSAAAVDSVLEAIGASFSLYDSLPLSLIQLVDQARREIKAWDIKIEIQDQVGNRHLVDLARSLQEQPS